MTDLRNTWRLLLLVGGALLAGNLWAQSGEQRLNIVFILIDDQRFDAFSFQGHPYLETPHLDRLAQEGTVFGKSVV